MKNPKVVAFTMLVAFSLLFLAIFVPIAKEGNMSLAKIILVSVVVIGIFGMYALVALLSGFRKQREIEW